MDLCLALLGAIVGPLSKRSAYSMRQTAALVIVGLLLSALAACNTVKGAGRDIESVGRAGEKVIN
jgi:predicted small secreted protein